MGTQWQGMGRKMMEVDVFKKSILQSDTLLKPYGVHLYNLIMEGDDSAFENIVHSFVGIAAIQVCVELNGDCNMLIFCLRPIKKMPVFL